MKLTIENTMRMADQVLPVVLRLLKTKYGNRDRSFGIYPYVNGRERGYCIWDFDRRDGVSFAEFRRSDDLVVYVGVEDMDDQYRPTKDSYAAAQFFNPWKDDMRVREHVKNPQWKQEAAAAIVKGLINLKAKRD